MTWNQRIIKTTEDGLSMFGVHEVYYDNGVPYSITEKSMFGSFESLEELMEEVRAYQECLVKPVLDMEDITKYEPVTPNVNFYYKCDCEKCKRTFTVLEIDIDDFQGTILCVKCGSRVHYDEYVEVEEE